MKSTFNEPVPNRDELADSKRGRFRVALVVDDSHAQRKVISALLKRWGFDVLEAASGAEALKLYRENPADLVVSDWMMPGMTGPELCDTIRNLDGEAYAYFILLSSKSEKAEIAHGLEQGADEFVTKPVNPQELRARIMAGERILEMQKELREKNTLLTTTLDELRGLYDLVDRDLVEARHLQQSLVPERHVKYTGADVSLLLRPSGHVGGDLVGTFRVNEARICAYSIDVSGHGIASALMTARLAAHLSGSTPENNVALEVDDLGFYTMRPTEEVCQELNRILLEEMDTEQYFTMAIADVNLRSGEVDLTQAGHPPPIVNRTGGNFEYVGGSSMPIGLFPDPSFRTFRATLGPGESLLLYSDGFPECENEAGEELGEAAFLDMMRDNVSANGEAFLESLVWSLTEFAGAQKFRDDVSAALIARD